MDKIMSEVCVFLADGFEEIEALTVVDLLRRAKVYVDTVSITDDYTVRGAHGIPVQTEDLITEIDFKESDMIVLPGGMPGTLHLGEHKGVQNILKDFHNEKKNIAAICAAPSVLGKYGILEGRRACCYPSFETQLTGAEVVFEPVVQDGHIVTSRGMGTAIPFALKLTEVLCGAKAANEVKESILFV